MSDEMPVDWDPRSSAVQDNQIAAYDDMRHRCPVAHSAYGNWAVFRHADVVRILDDPAAFSNRVSPRRSVPNGMDPPEHTLFRDINDRYFTPERMRAFEPDCREVTRGLLDALGDGEVEIMSALAEPFANHMQCRFMGWPERLNEPLREWARRNREATLALDREAMAAVAGEFDSYIREQLDERRENPTHDVTSELLAERVDGRPLSDDELVSMIRNWTVGELSTISAGVGIVASFLASRPDVQSVLRAEPDRIRAACDEILRIRPPLIANRRRTTRDVVVADRAIPAGERVLVLWASADRDEEIFGEPDEFSFDRDPEPNLLYGRGVHACPGAPLARLELTVLVEELLGATTSLTAAEGAHLVYATYPAGGYSEVSVSLVRR